MKIMIISGTVCDKKPVKKGQVISTSPEEAQTLITLGKAKPYEEFKEENRTPELENRVIEPKKLIKRPLKPANKKKK